MSTNNIVSKVPTIGGGLIVTFSTKDGRLRAWKYSGGAALAVIAGSDPHDVMSDGECSPSSVIMSAADMVSLAAETFLK